MEPNSTQAVKADPSVETKPVKRRKRGDTREDGFRFWQYKADCANGEYWVAPAYFELRRSRDALKKARAKADSQAKRGETESILHRGDVREDGKVFWTYNPTYRDGERWLTPEQFAARKAEEAEKRAASSLKRTAEGRVAHRGDVREDGKVFWTYGLGYANGEYWMTPERFAAERAKERAQRSRLSEKKTVEGLKFRQGDTREDGYLFWQYHPAHLNGEYWLSPEAFATKKAKKNARRRERRATDPLYVLKCRLRDRVSKSLKRKGFKKNTNTALLLGCAYEEFKAYTEARLPPGMTWETFLSDGHLDHIVPLDAAKTEEDVYALNHFTNLRPMWGPDNLAKNATLPEEHELPDNLHPKVREILERAIREAK